jgi:hypothetical protein
MNEHREPVNALDAFWREFVRNQRLEEQQRVRVRGCLMAFYALWALIVLAAMIAVMPWL